MNRKKELTQKGKKDVKGCELGIHDREKTVKGQKTKASRREHEKNKCLKVKKKKSRRVV